MSSVMIEIVPHTSKFNFVKKKITFTQNISITNNETVIQAVNNQSSEEINSFLLAKDYRVSRSNSCLIPRRAF